MKKMKKMKEKPKKTTKKDEDVVSESYVYCPRCGYRNIIKWKADCCVEGVYYTKSKECNVCGVFIFCIDESSIEQEGGVMITFR